MHLLTDIKRHDLDTYAIMPPRVYQFCVIGEKFDTLNTEAMYKAEMQSIIESIL